MPRRAGKLLSALTGLLLLAVGGSSCRSLAPDSRSDREPLRIGVREDVPPFSFRRGRKWAGVEADLGRALAQRLDMRPVFTAVPGDQLTEALLDGTVDILMAGVTVTEERRVRIDFSTPYLGVGQSALVRSADRLRYNTEIRIRSARARVGVVTGSPGGPLVSGYFVHARRIDFPGLAPAVEALRLNQIDVLIHDAPALWWQARQNPAELAIAPVLFARAEIAWGFRRGSVRLREAANQALADWQQDGTLETILRQWMPVSN